MKESKNANEPKKVILARYGEIHLKGNNRGFFLRALKQNLVKAIGDKANCAIQNSRVLVTDFAHEDTDLLISRVANVFGIVSVSETSIVKATPKDILDFVGALKVDGTFKVEVNRADKSFPHKSPEFAAMAGAAVLAGNKNTAVNVHAPQTVISIDIRESGFAYVYDKIVKGVGGMPVGTAGSALVMLSGGIDSPVAAWLSAKRGLGIDCVHFASPPYTSDFALEKVRDLARKLENFCGEINLFVVPFTEIQEQIRAHCHGEYMITLMRRFMVRIAEQIAIEKKIDCIITGENLSQVASQTVHGIASNNALAGIVPILRPLIMYDKEEIVALARKVDTYDISCRPYPDCCTVFVPSHPSIRPNLKRVEKEEQRLDTENLIARAIAGIEKYSNRSN